MEKALGCPPQPVSPDRFIYETTKPCFQINQRRDTLLAAQMAGFNIKAYDLLEEPTAALLDFLMSHTAETLFPRSTSSHVLVFDFGGGTCDVSIIQIELDRKTQQVKASMLAASRYHRLGGGDLDAAIVHEYLIPALVAENGLSPHELTYGQKKKGLEPQLLSLAESLKIALCKETDRLEKFGKYDSSDKKGLVARQPGLECFLGGQSFKLSQPQLSALEWEKILEPFLDGDYLYTRETDRIRLAPAPAGSVHVRVAWKDPDSVVGNRPAGISTNT